MFVHLVIASLFGMAAAAPYAPMAPIAVGVDSVSVPRYNFNYAVNDPHTGDNKAQHEVRDGGYVKGSYSLAEPDGTLRVVDYSADPVSGFNAVVKRVGPAAHPQYVAPIVAKQIVAPIAPIAAPIANIAPALSSVGLGGFGYGGLGSFGYGYDGLGYSSYGGYNNYGGYSNYGGYGNYGGYSDYGGNDGYGLKH